MCICNTQLENVINWLGGFFYFAFSSSTVKAISFPVHHCLDARGAES